MAVGKKVDQLVIGLMVTGMATLVAMAATGLWWYFWGRKMDEKPDSAMAKNRERLLSSKKEDVQDASKREKPTLKPKPELKPKPKSVARTQCPVPPIHNIRPSTSTAIEEDASNTSTSTSTRQGNNGARKEEQFADVMTQLKIQLDKKATGELGVGIGVGVGA